ncbi:hypothetical protein SPV_2571 [Streptococcus pneumoniae]|nr:hypothetical protein SPV_2571 [Streptococcus pneumoniae]
MECSKISSV